MRTESKPLVVLVVDDEAEITKMLVQWLDRKGHQAIGITGGSDAVDWVVHHHCDAVILDLMLKDTHGLALIAPIRKASPGIRIIVTTGIADADIEASALGEGADAYVEKPIDFGLLEALL